MPSPRATAASSPTEPTSCLFTGYCGTGQPSSVLEHCLYSFGGRRAGVYCSRCTKCPRTTCDFPEHCPKTCPTGTAATSASATPPAPPTAAATELGYRQPQSTAQSRLCPSHPPHCADQSFNHAECPDYSTLRATCHLSSTSLFTWPAQFLHQSPDAVSILKSWPGPSSHC